jgi:hypothetical protein
MDGAPYNAEENSRFSSIIPIDVKNKTGRELLMYHFFIHQDTSCVGTAVAKLG